MTTITDHRLSDSDLTVLVERAAKGVWDSNTPVGHDLEAWVDLDAMTKNAAREEALPVIFHGTKALHELGYRKPRTINTVEELGGLAEGAVLRDRKGEVAELMIGSWYRTADEIPLLLQGVNFPATVLWEPDFGAGQ